jgi:hypothetical protein
MCGADGANGCALGGSLCAVVVPKRFLRWLRNRRST